MAIIPCGDNCIYQIDGYCHLELSSFVANNAEGSCVYKICSDNTSGLQTNCFKRLTNSTNTNNFNIEIP